MSKGLSLYPTTDTGASDPANVTGTHVNGPKFAMDVYVQGGNLGENAVGETINEFNEITAVPSAATAKITEYTVPVGKTFHLQHIEGSGCNMGIYSVFVDGIKQAVKRTYFGGAPNVDFEFSNQDNFGLKVQAGLKVELFVENYRPESSDFYDGRILGVLL